MNATAILGGLLAGGVGGIASGFLGITSGGILVPLLVLILGAGHLAAQPKISKTTPCKVAGSRRHGCALGKYLTRRANQWHCFIIGQSVKRPWPGNSALFGAISGRKFLPTICSCIGSADFTSVALLIFALAGTRFYSPST
jgi:hypothetical protein